MKKDFLLKTYFILVFTLFWSWALSILFIVFMSIISGLDVSSLYNTYVLPTWKFCITSSIFCYTGTEVVYYFLMKEQQKEQQEDEEKE